MTLALQQKAFLSPVADTTVYLICFVGAAILFIFDWIAPLGIAGGVAYLLVIFLTILSTNSRVIFVVAVYCTVLTLGGYFLSPDIGTAEWIVLINRFLATLLIWSTAIWLFVLKQEKQSLKESEMKYRTLVESAPLCIHQIDSEGYIQSMNRAGLAMINETDEQSIIGVPYLNAVCDEDRERISGLMDDAFKGKFSAFEFRGVGGIEFSSNFVPIYNSSSKIDRLLGITEDITDRVRTQNELSYQASHDTLTGLTNRNEFENRANRLLSAVQHDKSEHAMCFLDLDQFKVINDTCGHPAGDKLLRQLAKLLQSTVRKRDTLARLGGDEFGVLMEHCPLDQANRVADTILKAINDYQFFWEKETFRIGASIGLVAITESTGNFANLFKQADAACYLAKDLGRNRIHVYHPDDTELAIRHGEMQWVGRINQALDDNMFCLYAQPIVALDGHSGKHYELLLRMLDEQEGIIPPGAFLPTTERYGLIEKLDAWVVNHACAFMAEHPTFVEQIDFISINLSGPSLTNKDFLETIMRNFREYGVSPGKICFEITETVAASNLESASNFISILKQLGCRFALDDFGSGISSFRYLKNLPVDYLKINGMFVKDIVNNPIDHALVKSINEVCHVMGMQTIAEFVENDEIKGMLKAIGVDYAQGYGLGKPQPLIELI